ncbi:hypothetical protein BLNAU_22023 [Blattamonas nauphoetae]|uniref:Uncharacterized protein n=1 Tax=Blattamonas nauphoetae TaxID=2049346 RepID=A0ABQ9WU76_9EUKA|nr:hypothetical protein BLNAU_22023 [Blattamonas nauphoetae]
MCFFISTPDSDHFEQCYLDVSNQTMSLSVPAMADNPFETLQKIISYYRSLPDVPSEMDTFRLQLLFDRHINHVSPEERSQLFSALGSAFIPRSLSSHFFIPVLRPDLSDDDRHSLLHSSGLVASLLRLSLEYPRNLNLLRFLEKCSSFYPIVMNESLSDLFITFIDTVCVPNWSAEDLSPDEEQEICALSLAILERESLACAVMGLSLRVLDHLFSAFPNSSDEIATASSFITFHKVKFSNLLLFLLNSLEMDGPIERIEDIANKILISPGYSQICQFLGHISRVLRTHPDLIARFFDTQILIQLLSVFSSHNHDIRHTSVDLLSPFTNPPPQLLANAISVYPNKIHFFVASTLLQEPCQTSISILFRLIENHPSCLPFLSKKSQTPIETRILEYVCHTLRVLSDNPDQPRCLSFGRDTPVLKTILSTLSTAITQDSPKQDESPKFHSFLVLLILCTASTDDDLSTEAIALAASLFQLPVSQTIALLHHTPPITSLPPDWPLVQGEEEGKTGIGANSLGAYSGDVINQTVNHPPLLPPDTAAVLTERMLNCLLGCLVSALRAASPPHSLPQTPFYSSLTQPSKEEREMWNNPAYPSTHSSLQSLVQRVLPCLFHYQGSYKQWDPNNITTLAVSLHLFPFVDHPTKEQVMEYLSSQIWIFVWQPLDIRDHLARIVLEVVSVDPFVVSTKLIWFAKEFVRTLVSLLETDEDTTWSDLVGSLRRRMGEAEGDEKWRVFVQLCAVIDAVGMEAMKMLLLAETNRHALLTLTIVTPQPINWTSETSKVMEESTRRLVCLAKQTEDDELCAAAWRWLEQIHLSASNRGEARHATTLEPDAELEEAILGVLGRMVQKRREGVGEGEVVGEDRRTAEVVVPCLPVLGVQLERRTLNATPFLPVLASLALTTDIPLLNKVIDVFAIISKTTAASPSPFTLSAITTPFLTSSDPHPQPRSLLFVIASILLHSTIDLSRSSDSFEYFPFLHEQPPSPLVIPIINEIVRQGSDLIVFTLAQPRRVSLIPSPTAFESTSQPTPNEIVSAVFCFVFSSIAYMNALLNRIPPPDFSRFMNISLRQKELEDEISRFADRFLDSFNSDVKQNSSKSPSCQLLQTISLFFMRSEQTINNQACMMYGLTYSSINPFPADLHPTFVAFREEGLEDMIEKTDDSHLWWLLKQFGANCPFTICFTPQTITLPLIYTELLDEEELINRLIEFEREEYDAMFDYFC